jgi:hypothetical protein
MDELSAGGLYALLSRTRLSLSAPVLETAEAVIRIIASTYLKPNLTPEADRVPRRRRR